MACTGCSVQFGVLKKKKPCSMCNHDYCSSCLLKDNNNRCFRCRVLFTIPLDRSSLMGLKVRDLQWYLRNKAVSIHGCKEKTELVDLILQSSGFWNSTSTSRQDRSPNIGSSYPFNSPRSSTSALNILSSFNHQEDQNSPRHPGSMLHEEDFKESVNKQESMATKESSFKPLSLDDVESVDRINEMSVRQLKLILTRNFIDYKGVNEKNELQDLARRLWKQKQQSKDIDVIKDEDLCKICMERMIDSVLLECGHMTTCTSCGKQLNECPICRQYIVRVVHVFKA